MLPLSTLVWPCSTVAWTLSDTTLALLQLEWMLAMSMSLDERLASALMDAGWSVSELADTCCWELVRLIDSDWLVMGFGDPPCAPTLMTVPVGSVLTMTKDKENKNVKVTVVTLIKNQFMNMYFLQWLWVNLHTCPASLFAAITLPADALPTPFFSFCSPFHQVCSLSHYHHPFYHFCLMKLWTQ